MSFILCDPLWLVQLSVSRRRRYCRPRRVVLRCEGRKQRYKTLGQCGVSQNCVTQGGIGEPCDHRNLHSGLISPAPTLKAVKPRMRPLSISTRPLTNPRVSESVRARRLFSIETLNKRYGTPFAFASLSLNPIRASSGSVNKRSVLCAVHSDFPMLNSPAGYTKHRGTSRMKSSCSCNF